jgi:hypothetical protein
MQVTILALIVTNMFNVQLILCQIEVTSRDLFDHLVLTDIFT